MFKTSVLLRYFTDKLAMSFLYLVKTFNCHTYEYTMEKLAFQEEQDEIFLSQVKNQTLYYIGDSFHIFANFSKDGRLILLSPDEF